MLNGRFSRPNWRPTRRKFPQPSSTQASQFSCRALSRRDANPEISAAFLHETFSTFSKVRLAIHKTTGICRKDEWDFSVPIVPEPKIDRGKKTIPEKRHSIFRKWLWLIPFTLAKKLLTVSAE
jgi:hypothetical protein